MITWLLPCSNSNQRTLCSCVGGGFAKIVLTPIFTKTNANDMSKQIIYMCMTVELSAVMKLYRQYITVEGSKPTWLDT